MAGRPKMMANKITDLEKKTEEVLNLISEYIPEQYEYDDGALENDPLCIAWNDALQAATDATHSMSNLAMRLRDKAGIPESESRLAFLKELEPLLESHREKQRRESVGVG